MQLRVCRSGAENQVLGTPASDNNNKKALKWPNRWENFLQRKKKGTGGRTVLNVFQAPSFPITGYWHGTSGLKWGLFFNKKSFFFSSEREKFTQLYLVGRGALISYSFFRRMACFQTSFRLPYEESENSSFVKRPRGISHLFSPIENLVMTCFGTSGRCPPCGVGQWLDESPSCIVLYHPSTTLKFIPSDDIPSTLWPINTCSDVNYRQKMVYTCVGPER